MKQEQFDLYLIRSASPPYQTLQLVLHIQLRLLFFYIWFEYTMTSIDKKQSHMIRV